MGNVIRSIIVAILLAALSFIAGSLAADGAQQALIPAIAVLGVFFLLYLGKNCWWLVFLAPPLLGLMDLSFLRNLPVSFLLCGIILVYWLLMFIMGYVKVVWNGVIWMDLVTLIFVAYFLYGYVRHPVTLAVFQDITDTSNEDIGGKEYIWCLAACMAYVAISIIPNTVSSLLRVFKYVFILSFILTVLMTFRGLASGGGYSAELAATSNYSPFGAIGGTIWMYLLAKYSIFGLVAAPWRFVLLALAGFCSAMGGKREDMILSLAYAGCCFAVHRSLVVVCILGACTYGMLLYMSSEKILYDLPYGVQRVLSMVPGMDIKKEIRDQAGHSWTWRVEMWEQALEPRSGYIKDYVWGDGFVQDVRQLRLTTIALNRGAIGAGNQRFFMETGTWHSGIITSIHRIGYVGLVLTAIWSLCACFMTMRVAFALLKKKGYEFAYYTILGVPGLLLLFYGSAGTFLKFFGFFYQVAVAKVLYSLAIKEGLLNNLFDRSIYVPLMLQEAQQAPRPRNAEI